MGRKYISENLIPVIKKRLTDNLTNVDILGNTVTIPVYEWGAEHNRPLPRVVVGNDGGNVPDDTYKTFGNNTEVYINVYSDSENNGVYEINRIANLVIESLSYKPQCGVAYDLPGFDVLAAELVNVIPTSDPDTNDHRKIIIMMYYNNQVA